MSNKDCPRTEHQPGHGITLKRPCRARLWHRVPLTLKELSPQVKIVTDPNKLAQLKAEASRRKEIAGRSCKAKGRRPAD